MKIKRIFLFIVIIVICVTSGWFVMRYVEESQYAEAITLVEAYISANELGIAKGSREYETLLRDAIYWNSHPELMEGENGELVRTYAKYYLTRDYPNRNTELALPPTPSK